MVETLLRDYNSLLMKSFESGRHIPISVQPIKSTRETFSASADAKMVATTDSDGLRDGGRQTEKDK